MRLKNIPGAREAVASDKRVINSPEEIQTNWKDIFGNDRPIYVEIGMGKGRFIIEMAERYPEINFIGIDRYESVMIKALNKLDRMGDAAPENIRFIRMDAEDIPDYFKEKEISRIYLNFSDPWPKKRHSKRRLQSPQFLEKYDRLLKDDGQVEFKTDNTDLFDFALESLQDTCWKILYQTRDLHSDEEAMADNVMTEYEEKFSAKGQKICKYIIKRGDKE